MKCGAEMKSEEGRLLFHTGDIIVVLVLTLSH